MKQLKSIIPFLLTYSVTFIPLFWPLELIRIIPYFIMFLILSKIIKEKVVNSTLVYAIFFIGVFFDIAPFFSSIPFVTTLCILASIGIPMSSKDAEGDFESKFA